MNLEEMRQERDRLDAQIAAAELGAIVVIDSGSPM